MIVAGLLATSGVSAAPDISIGHLLLQMVVAMVLVVGGIWGFGKLMGRSRAAGRNAGRAAGGLFRARSGSRSNEEGLTILSRQPVGKGKYIAVVQVGGQQFLVGIGDSGLTPLGELRAGDPEPAPDTEPLPVAARHDDGPALDFGAAELAALDLSALGVRSLDLAAHAPARPPAAVPRSTAAPGGRRPLATARGASGQRAAARPPASQVPAAGRALRHPAARGVSAPETASQQPRSMRSLVDALREATVRR